MAEASPLLGQLLDILPDLPEFDSLRQALRSASLEEEPGDWSGRSRYRTVDRRTVAVGSLGTLLSETEHAAQRRLKRLYDAVSIAFFASMSDAADEKAQQIVALGEAAEAGEQWRDALSFYLLALGVVADCADLRLRALVQRRVGRTALNTGDFARAAFHYGAGLAAASAASDTEGQIIAATGLGNLASYQGQWLQAHEWYTNALKSCGSAYGRERAQLLVNDSMTFRERELYGEARGLMEQARSEWHEFTEADHAGWYNNMGLLLLAEGGSMQEADACFENALKGEPGHFHSAMVHVNRAEVALRNGDLEQAQARCREAEVRAIAHGSPRVLAEVYLQLGKVAARRQDPNGVAFFELAVKLTKEQAYPLVSAEISYEFGRYRKQFGENAAARGLFEDALRRFALLGASTEVLTVERELNALPL